MNLFANNTGKEAISQPAPPEPYVARRAVRYAAAENAQAALQRQFPGMSFGATAPVVMAEAAPVAVAEPTPMTEPTEPAFVDQTPVEQVEQVMQSQNPIDATLKGV